MLKRIVIGVFSIFAGFLALGQDKKIDKLEMYYDQGNYTIVLRKSERLMRKEGYEKHPAPAVFHVLAEYQLGKAGNTKFSTATAVYDYEKFLELDSLYYYQKAYGNYIYDLQMGIADEIRVLSEKGETEKAKIKYDTYHRLFGNIAQFDELVSSNSNVDTEAAAKEVKDLSSNELRDKIIKEAKKHIGTAYKYGGITPKGFDCSGFTQYVYSKNGKVLPRTAQSQADTYHQVKLSKVRPGDLLFFGSSKSNISHVGIVVSGTSGDALTMIHASSSRGIMISNVDNDTYWKPKLQFAVSILE